jgi:glycosyltransferase involved in cell wall biosynthesis
MSAPPEPGHPTSEHAGDPIRQGRRTVRHILSLQRPGAHEENTRFRPLESLVPRRVASGFLRENTLVREVVMKPRVTVTIPTYNRARFVGAAIDSVLGQSVDAIEVFVSDNASTDDTRAVVLGIDDPRVHYVRNERNLGVHANLSRGLELGSAPFVCVLPDDDMMLPGNLEKKVRLLEDDPELDIVHGPSRLVHVGPGGEELGSNNYLTGGPEAHVEDARVVLRHLLSDSYWINFPAALIRRSIIGDVRFESRDELADDLGLFMRLCRNARTVGYIAEPLVALRMHADAHSTKQGFHGLADDAFLPDVTAIAHIERGRERFLRQYGHEVSGVRELRAASRRWARDKLVWVVGRRSRGDAATSTRARLLRDSLKIEPLLALDPRFVKLSVQTLAGRHGRRVLQHARRTFTREHG